jgi:hypothetical protein
MNSVLICDFLDSIHALVGAQSTMKICYLTSDGWHKGVPTIIHDGLAADLPNRHEKRPNRE